MPEPDFHAITPVGEAIFIHEPEVMDVMLRMIKPGMCCLDCGANDGYFTGFMSYLVGPSGLVIGFEPDKKVYKQLVENTKELDNVILKKSALWCVDRPMTFHRAEYSGYSSFVRYEDIGEESYVVMARALDTLLLAPQPNFIKVDCEGADEKVLRGAENILRKGVAAVTVELNFYINHQLGCNDKTLREFMAALGYDCFLLEKKRKPLYVPPESIIQEKKSNGGESLSIVNAMFAPIKSVEEAWQYDAKDYFVMRVNTKDLKPPESETFPDIRRGELTHG